MQRATVDDLREIMAYYKLQADERALAQWQATMDRLAEKKRQIEAAPPALGVKARPAP